MEYKDFKIEKYPQEIAKQLYELSKDMDYMDYEDEKEKVIAELEKALYHLKTVCENEHNKEYFRILYRILEKIEAV